MITKKDFYNREVFMLGDDENALKFRRIVGGLGWPGERPGFAVIVGELEKQQNGIYPMHLLEEFESSDMDRLVRRCADLQAAYEEPTFVGRLDESAVQFLNHYNRDRNTKDFALYEAPFSDNELINYHITVLKGMLRPDRKALHFNPKSKIPSYLLELPQNKIYQAKATDFPAVAALAYCVAYIQQTADYQEINPDYLEPEAEADY